MMTGPRKLAVLGSLVGALAVGAAGTAYATTTTYVLSPANTAVSGALKSGTTLQFNGDIDGIGVTVTCTSLSVSGTTPAAGLTVPLSPSPVFSGCTDSLGGTDTVKTNGDWSLTAIPNSKNLAKSTGTLNVPKAGATFSSSVLSSCVITVAPTKAAAIKASYNNAGTITFTAAKSKFAIKGSGCTTSATSTVASTVTLSPVVKIVAS